MRCIMLETLKWPLRRGRRSSDSGISGNSGRQRWSILPVLLYLLFAATVSAKGLMAPEPEFVEPLQNVTVTAGRDIKLQCSVKHLASFKVAWIHLERSGILTVQNRVITRNPRISVSHDQHHRWNLHINNIQESDSGGYMCQINTAVAKTRIGHVTVVVPPSINDELSSSDVTAREHSAVTLRCNATGSPPLSVRWRREDRKLININRTLSVMEWEGTHLYLSRINREDMGAYLCIASNGIPPIVSKRIPLSVEFAPSVSVPNQLVGIPIGSTVMLDCHLESSPLALHFWNREDGLVLHESAKYHMQSMSGPSASPNYKTHLRLTIANVTSQDYGSYRCVAKNHFGEADGHIKLYPIQSVTAPTVPYTRSPPVAAVSPDLEWSPSVSKNKTKLRLTDDVTGKARFSDNKFDQDTKNEEGNPNSKSSKVRSNSGWNFIWDPKTSNSGSPRSTLCSMLILITMMLNLVGSMNCFCIASTRSHFASTSARRSTHRNCY